MKLLHMCDLRSSVALMPSAEYFDFLLLVFLHDGTFRKSQQTLLWFRTHVLPIAAAAAAAFATARCLCRTVAVVSRELLLFMS